ncbi:hypothetical protein GGQ72_003916 [Rhizobium rhizoryzae]|uniref:Uncharacterized protein n=1 Tax=Rhizobium rhizoryzae TaxID=451876 RepID=A0A7W6LJP2_9HYPH|nr:hypothetical protein [Rhizobium rhizoryzae]
MGQRRQTVFVVVLAVVFSDADATGSDPAGRAGWQKAAM